MPIVIKSAQIIGEGAADSIDGLHIVLPLNPGKITDSVSVSFNRRIDNTAGSTIATMLSEKVLSSFGEFSLSVLETFLFSFLVRLKCFKKDLTCIIERTFDKVKG